MLKIFIFFCLVHVTSTEVKVENKSTCNLSEKIKQQFNKCVKLVWSPIKIFIKDSGNFAIGLEDYEKIMRFPNKMVVIKGACALLNSYERCVTNLIQDRNDFENCFHSNPKHKLLSTAREVLCRENDWQSAIEVFDPCANALANEDGFQAMQPVLFAVEQIIDKVAKFFGPDGENQVDSCIIYQLLYEATSQFENVAKSRRECANMKKFTNLIHEIISRNTAGTSCCNTVYPVDNLLYKYLVYGSSSKYLACAAYEKKTRCRNTYSLEVAEVTCACEADVTANAAEVTPNAAKGDCGVATKLMESGCGSGNSGSAVISDWLKRQKAPCSSLNSHNNNGSGKFRLTSIIMLASITISFIVAH